MLRIESLNYATAGAVLLKEINLSFSSGNLCALIGLNGAGKSTLLKTLIGVLIPTSGKIFWKNENLHTLSRKQISRIISLVSQNPTPLFDFTVNEIVAMGSYSCSPYEKGVSLQEALEAVDGWHLRNRSISSLSSGERQRIFIARALMTNASIILLDEPTANLDIRHQEEIWTLLKTLADKGKIIVVATHDLGAADRHCNLTCILKQGACLAFGCTKEMMSHQRIKEAFWS